MHLSTRLLFLALLCLTVVPDPMSLVAHAHRHPHRHAQGSPPAKTLSLPACAQAAFDSAIAAGCKKKKAGCLCRKQSVLDGFIASIRSKCSATDVAAAESDLESFCGVDLVVPAASTATTTKVIKTTKKPPSPAVVMTTTRPTTTVVTKSQPATAVATVTKTKPGQMTTSVEKTTADSTKTSSTQDHSQITSTKTHKVTTTTSHQSGSTAAAHSSNGRLFLGGAGRVEVGLECAAFALTLMVMGWTFEEL